MLLPQFQKQNEKKSKVDTNSDMWAFDVLAAPAGALSRGNSARNSPSFTPLATSSMPPLLILPSAATCMNEHSPAESLGAAPAPSIIFSAKALAGGTSTTSRSVPSSPKLNHSNSSQFIKTAEQDRKMKALGLDPLPPLVLNSGSNLTSGLLSGTSHNCLNSSKPTSVPSLSMASSSSAIDLDAALQAIIDTSHDFKSSYQPHQIGGSINNFDTMSHCSSVVTSYTMEPTHAPTVSFAPSLPSVGSPDTSPFCSAAPTPTQSALSSPFLQARELSGRALSNDISDTFSLKHTSSLPISKITNLPDVGSRSETSLNTILRKTNLASPNDGDEDEDNEDEDEDEDDDEEGKFGHDEEFNMEKALYGSSRIGITNKNLKKKGKCLNYQEDQGNSKDTNDEEGGVLKEEKKKSRKGQLFLGGWKMSFKKFIQKQKINYIVNAARVPDILAAGDEERRALWLAESAELESTGVGYFRLPWFDVKKQRLWEKKPWDQLSAAVLAIYDALSEGKNVLVHCRKGRSRSATVVTSYLMARRGFSRNVAIEYIKECRPSVSINSGFMAQLHTFERSEQLLKLREKIGMHFVREEASEQRKMLRKARDEARMAGKPLVLDPERELENDDDTDASESEIYQPVQHSSDITGNDDVLEPKQLAQIREGDECAPEVGEGNLNTSSLLHNFCEATLNASSNGEEQSISTKA